MSIPVWTKIGSATPAGSGTTIAITLSANQDPGTIIVMGGTVIANPGFSGATAADTRSGSNAYQQDLVGNNANRSATVFSSKVGTLLQSGDIVSMSCASGSGRVGFVYQVTNLDQTTWFNVAKTATGTSAAPNSGTQSMVAGDYALLGVLSSSNASAATVGSNNQSGTYSILDQSGQLAMEQMEVIPGSTLLYQAAMSQTSTAWFMGMAVYNVATGAPPVVNSNFFKLF